MKKILPFLLILMYSCGRNHNKKNDLQEYNLKGKVKCITRLYYEQVDTMGQIAKGDIISKQTMCFDDSGNLTSLRWFNGDQLMGVDTFLYDAKHRKIELQSLSPNMICGNKFIYSYRKNDQISEEKIYTSKGLDYTRFYTYNKNGSIHHKQGVKNGDTSYSRVTYLYDSNGNILEESEYFHNSLFKQTKSFFNADNKMIRQEQTIFQNRFTVSSFNENGDITDVKSTSLIDSSDIFYVYRYEYDEKKNWIRQTIVSNETTNTVVCESKIEYY